MKEIGGYFGLERSSGKEYYPDAIPLNTGRNALLYLLKARNVKKLYLPYYLCDCCSDICHKNGYKYEYYHIDKYFRPVFDKKLCDGEYLYVVNYFGRTCMDDAEKLKAEYGNVIFDNVQAFFSKPSQNMDTIYSCRKFFGVPDGAYIFTDSIISGVIETDTSALRMKHILGRFEGLASDYYDDFRQSDEALYDLPLRYMSPLTHNLLRTIDYEAVRTQRNENYAFLQNALGSRNIIDAPAPDGPYCYPFYCKNGTQIRQQLAGMKIYIPTLWPNVPGTEGVSELEQDYAANILPLPCDQRYSSPDMEYIVENIENNL